MYSSVTCLANLASVRAELAQFLMLALGWLLFIPSIIIKDVTFLDFLIDRKENSKGIQRQTISSVVLHFVHLIDSIFCFDFLALTL